MQPNLTYVFAKHCTSCGSPCEWRIEQHQQRHAFPSRTKLLRNLVGNRALSAPATEEIRADLLFGSDSANVHCGDILDTEWRRQVAEIGEQAAHHWQIGG